MEKQYLYFANARMAVPQSSVLEEWKQFLEPLPYQFELEISEGGEIPEKENGKTVTINRIQVTELKNGWLLETADNDLSLPGAPKNDRAESKVFVDKEYKNIRYNTVGSGEASKGNIRPAVETALSFHGGSVIHASCVVHREKALLFCAPSQTGKSTQARLWEEHFGTHMISSDAPAVFPGTDGAAAYGMPWDGSDHIITQESAPIAAIIELRQAKRNAIRRLTSQQAFRMLMKQGHLPMWDSEGMFMEMAVLKKLSVSVPFYRLNCRPDCDAAQLVHQVVFEGKTENLKGEEKEMKIKEGFILRNVMDENIVMPTGNNMQKFEGAIVLSDTAAFAWEKLQNNISKSELIAAVLDEFEADQETVEKEVSELLDKLNSYEVLENLGD